MKNQDQRFEERLRAGDELAVMQTRGWIRRTLKGYAAALGAEIEDLEQEVLVTVLENLRDGKFERRSSLATFVRAIAHHRCVDLLRARSRRTFEGVDDLDLEAAGPSPYEKASGKEDAQFALEVLQALPESCREMLRLVHQGYGYQEMAERLAVAPGTLRVRLMRCRRKAQEIRDRRRT